MSSTCALLTDICIPLRPLCCQQDIYLQPVSVDTDACQNWQKSNDGQKPLASPKLQILTVTCLQVHFKAPSHVGDRAAWRFHEVIF